MTLSMCTSVAFNVTSMALKQSLALFCFVNIERTNLMACSKQEAERITQESGGGI